MMAFLAGPLGKLAGWAVAAVAIAGALWRAIAAVQNSGVQKQQAAEAKATLADVKVSNEIDDETRRANPADVASGLQRWNRD